MALQTIITRNGITAFHKDSTFGSIPSSGYTRCYPNSDVIVALDQPGIERMDQRDDNFGAHGYVQGLRSGKCEMSFALRPRTGVLNAAASTATSSLWSLLGLAFGGTFVQGAGSAIDSLSTTTVLNVTAGQGARFKVGSFVGVQPNSGTTTPTVFVAQVTDVTADAVTIHPALPVAPAVGRNVYNTETVYAAQSIADSVTFAHLPAGLTGNQTMLVSCTLDPQVTFEIGQLAGVKLGVTAATYLGPNEGGQPTISTAYAVDDMGTPIVGGRGVSLAADAHALDYATSGVELRKATLALNLGNGFLTQLDGIEGKAGVARIPPQRSAAKLTVEMRYSVDNYDSFRTDSVLSFLHSTNDPNGRAVFAYIPAMMLTKQVEVANDGGLTIMRLEFASITDETMLTVAASSPLRSQFFLGAV